MSFLTLKEKKTILLLFTRVERPKAIREMEGFNHVAYGWCCGDEMALIIEPALQGANIDFVHIEELERNRLSGACAILELDVSFTFTQKLFKESFFQTCATFVQYLAGIDLGATFAQTLFNKLTKRSAKYLARHGILEVRRWELKQHSLQPEPS